MDNTFETFSAHPILIKNVYVFTETVIEYITMQVAIPPLLLPWVKTYFSFYIFGKCEYIHSEFFIFLKNIYFWKLVDFFTFE